MKKMKKISAFSLMELLIVISIIVILSGAFLIPRFVGVKNSAKIAATKSNLITIKTVLENYYLDCGKYPSATTGLKALVEDADSVGIAWSGPYLTKLPKDPWMNAYVYTYEDSSESYLLKSYGADGKEGGTGINSDITE